nr:Ig-like domain repeat protein [Nocardioides sp.]
PVNSLTTGTYTWQVTGLDASGNALGSSSRTFTVNTGLTTASPPQVLAPDGTGVGKTLTSVPPTWAQSGVTNTYQWLRDNNEIGNASGTTYPLTPDDFGKAISLRVTGRLSGYTDTTVVSNAVTASAGGALIATSAPVLSGTPVVGNSLSTTSGNWSQPSTTFTYQWLRDGAVIPGATGNSYQLVAADAARSISAAVTAKRAAFEAGTATTLPVTVAKLKSSTSLSLSAAQIKPRKKVKITVVVAVPNVARPIGTIKFMDGTKVFKSVSLTSSQSGKVTLAWKKFNRGKHKIKAVYSGSPTTTGSTSKPVKLVVKR